ncbi:MAG: hypothetical protein JW741_12345 [Sedimentisphaerales bacterium]|nr:hypothetical protein [Sedimentisphaerales bacterium]
MKTSHRLIVAGSLLALASPLALGGIQTWIGPGTPPGNNWNNTSNWQGGVVPGIGNTEEVGVGTAFTGTIIVDVDVPTAGTYKSQKAGQDYKLDLQGNTLDISGGQIGRNMSTTWSTWRLEITDTVGGGTFDCAGNPAFLNTNSDDDEEVEQATWVFSGDIDVVFGAFYPVSSGNGNSVYPALGTVRVQDDVTLSATSIILANNTQLGTTGPGMTGEIHVKDQASVTSTGTFVVGGDDAGVQPGKGLGRIRVTGKDASVHVTGPGFILENAELVFEIDYLTDDATPPISVSNKFRIDVSPIIDIDLVDVEPVKNQVYDLVSYGSYEDNDAGLTLAAEDEGTWELILNTAEKKIQAKYVVPSNLGTLITVR